MKKASTTIMILLGMILQSCHAQPISDLEQSVFLFKDKDGLYLYEPQSGKEVLVFDAGGKTFLNEIEQPQDNLLQFGFRGELISGDAADEAVEEYYSTEHYSVNLATGENWLSQKTRYKVYKNRTLNIETQMKNSKGENVCLHDTTVALQGASYSVKRVVYNTPKPRFYSSHSLAGKTVFSQRGSIYYVENQDTTLLVEYKGNFDPKFGSGYFQPQISPKGTYVVFRYLPGMNFKEKPSLQRINLKSKELETLKEGVFGAPAFSKDGRFLLFQRDQKQAKKDTWKSTIYVLDMRTLEEKRIGRAYSAAWKN